MASRAVTTITRPLHADERDLLRFLAQGESVRASVEMAAGCTLFVGLVVFAAIVIGWKMIQGCACGTDPRPIALTLAAVLGALASWTLWREAWTRWRAGIPNSPLARDLHGGVAAQFTARIRRAVEIAEYEDEGTGFFLELEDGRILTVIGQDLYDYAHDGTRDPDEPPPPMVFPAQEITYAYAPESGTRLNLRTAGAGVRPVGLVRTTRAHFATRSGTPPLPHDGAIDEGPLERVFALYEYHLEALSA